MNHAYHRHTGATTYKMFTGNKPDMKHIWDNLVNLVHSMYLCLLVIFHSLAASVSSFLH